MNSQNSNIFSLWFSWQFNEVPKFLLEVWSNYFVFMTNFFSIPGLLKTFFSPWHRYQWRYPKGFDIQEFFSTLVSNIFSRMIGVLLRIVLIITGICLDFFVIVAGALVLMAWLLLPVLLAGLILFIFIF